jgi:hypothetical protein
MVLAPPKIAPSFFTKPSWVRARPSRRVLPASSATGATGSGFGSGFGASFGSGFGSGFGTGFGSGFGTGFGTGFGSGGAMGSGGVGARGGSGRSGGAATSGGASPGASTWGALNACRAADSTSTRSTCVGSTEVAGGGGGAAPLLRSA